MTKTVSTSAVELLPRNRYRKSLIFQNEDTTDTIYLKKERLESPSVSSTDHDHRLGPGASLTLNSGTDGIESTQDRWTAVSSANTPRISFFETEDIVR